MREALFPTIVSQGGVLPADLLRRVSLMDRDLPGLRAEDYQLAPGERITDAIVRSWNRLLPIWERFAEPDTFEAATEESTREQWTRWLFEELGFPHLEPHPPVVIDERPYPVSHRGNGVPLHMVAASADLEARPGAGERAPHAMVQELLNRDHEHLWAMVTNGRQLRVLRDSSSLTRQAYCQFDLEQMFGGQHFADFAVCWLTCHASRFAPVGSAADDEASGACWLQRWSEVAAAEGVRALDELRAGVEAAIEALGSGLLHPDNDELLARLRAGALTTDEFRHQLLRLVYRLLFLLVAEARNLLHDEQEVPAEIKERYRDSYSMERLVTLARRQRGSLHGDLWAGLQVVFRALAGPGAPPLGLVGLGSFLWSPEATPDVDRAVIPNRALLDAVDHLTSFEVGGVRRRIDYKHLGSEELGGVYESLLETHVEPDLAGQRLVLSRAAGNERKTTGSYYTPTPLVRVLLDSALDPVLDEAERADDPEAAILDLKVLDPAVGSGHFLIAAANRIAYRLAGVRAGFGEPSPDEVRHALREVIGRCVYGIDVNPLSVELCKVSLWMEAAEPGKALSFLEHHIVLGNGLLGTTPALIEAGLPDAAFKALGGDDKAVVTSMKKRNKLEREGQGGFAFGADPASDALQLAKEVATLDELADDDAAVVDEKAQRFAELIDSPEARRLKLAADAWCAAFVSPKTSTSLQITTDLVRRCGQDADAVGEADRAAIQAIQREYGFLHLHVAFPWVFRPPTGGEAPENEKTGWSGGFDVVLGNPPWDQVQYDPRETFAASHPEIATASTMAKRNRLIAGLEVEEPHTYQRYVAAVRAVDGVKHFAHASDRFPLGSVGRLNTAPLFLELMWGAIAPSGRVGVVVPTGIATDSFTQEFFRSLVERHSLVSLYDFENRRGIFPGIHRSTKFCLLTLRGDHRAAADAEFVFFALGVDDLDDDERRFTLTADDFALLNPNTRTCPVFRSKRDAEITKGIYRRVPVLVKEGDPDGNPWGFKGQLMFMMNTDSHLFRTRDELEADGWTLEGNHFVKGDERHLPLYEAKMIHHFDHRWATYEGDEIRDCTLAERIDPCHVALPKYWVSRSEVYGRGGQRRWSLGWRDIASNTNERTLIAAFAPEAGFGNKFPLMRSDPDSALQAGLCSAAGSFVADFVARQKVSTATLNFFFVKQFAVPAPQALRNLALGRVVPAVLELTYTAWDMEPFARDLGFDGPPFRWHPQRRALLRAEMDALMFRLYGIVRDDVDYILDTFPIVKRKDEAEFGEFRTKRLILERYDAMAAAEAAGEEYQTALDPPPADPSLCHPESTRPSWAQSSQPSVAERTMP